mgnify:CR=1 FL=1
MDDFAVDFDDFVKVEFADVTLVGGICCLVAEGGAVRLVDDVDGLYVGMKDVNARKNLELRNSISIDFPSSIIQKSKIELPKIKEPQIVLNEEEK